MIRRATRVRSNAAKAAALSAAVAYFVIAPLSLLSVHQPWQDAPVLPRRASADSDQSNVDVAQCVVPEGTASTLAIELLPPTLPTWANGVQWRNPFQVLKYYARAGFAARQALEARWTGNDGRRPPPVKHIVVAVPQQLLRGATNFGLLLLATFVLAADVDSTVHRVSFVDVNRVARWVQRSEGGHAGVGVSGGWTRRLCRQVRGDDDVRGGGDGSIGGEGGASTRRTVGEISDVLVVERGWGGSRGTERCTCHDVIETFDPSMGTVRGRWMQDAHEVARIKHASTRVCEMSSPSQVTSARRTWRDASEDAGSSGDAGGARGSTMRKAVIFQRDLDRFFVNPTGIAKRLGSALGPSWALTISKHDDNMPPCKLVRMTRDCELLLLSHGFSSLLVLFQRPGAMLVEVFPYKFWKAPNLESIVHDGEGYEPLARRLGVGYMAFNSTAQDMLRTALLWWVPMLSCMSSKRCRKFARSGNVEMTDAQVDTVAGRFHDRESAWGQEKIVKK